VTCMTNEQTFKGYSIKRTGGGEENLRETLGQSDMFFSCDPQTVVSNFTLLRQFSCRFYPLRQFFVNFITLGQLFLPILPPSDSFFHPFYPLRQFNLTISPLRHFPKNVRPSDTFSWDPLRQKIAFFYPQVKNKDFQYPPRTG